MYLVNTLKSIKTNIKPLRVGIPMNTLSIKHLESLSELQKLISVFSQAFESEYSTTDAYLKVMLENKQAVFLGAYLDKKVVGGLVAFEMTPIHGIKELYIYDIAILPEYQKQGIGAKLIEHLKLEAKNRGVGTIFVEAESEDSGAVAFYRAIGGEEVQVNHFNFNL